ncbi:N-acetylmuramoyl-L-alanine amidase family protein [Salinimicrobium soli]|uniref:N-acetylmuramoyl-L-alanine amidase family protein n=1 Tax=Salinimicrobium soli TaxID=1254399 RepID=UPI003AADA003
MKLLSKITVLLLISLSLSFTNTDKRTVIIDVGHGGKDPGNISNGISEKTVVLNIARKIKAMNENEDLEIILTRDSDVGMTLKDRTDFINKTGADLMISLHLNAHSRDSKKGIELFTGRSSNMPSQLAAHLAIKMKEALAADFEVSEVKQANFRVLKETHCPAILIEMGFLSNPEDREFLTSEEGQEQMARSIYELIQ